MRSIRQKEVLAALTSYAGKHGSGVLVGVAEPGWCRARDIGGSRDSHHSLTLRRLAAMGLVETRTIESAKATTKPLRLYRAKVSG